MTTTLTERPAPRATAPVDGPRSAVLNPYALAELIAGRRVEWRRIDNVPRALEDLLQTPYEELFDPIHGGPLYTGLRLTEDLKVVPQRSPLLDVTLSVDVSDIDQAPDAEIWRLADLGPRFRVHDVGSIPVASVRRVPGRLELTLREPEADRLQRLARVLTPDVVRTISRDPGAASPPDWTPPNGSWGDGGRFFDEAAEFFDPIQGSVANCYLIAALSAVAWASPYRIAHLTRATGLPNQQFTNLVRFYRPDSGGQIDREIEVTDRIPLTSWGAVLYCRSSEAGEIWPSVYEKAYAKLETGTAGDQPDILATEYGDCIWATAQLTGGHRHYYATAGHTADQLWDLVRANSLGGRTFNPMTAWTYPSGAASEKKIVYADANVVANHCYTVLGWDYRDGRKYIVLRNPWGSTEATAGALGGTVWMHDISWWRPIALANPDGTFAMEAGAFKTYFAGHGVAK